MSTPSDEVRCVKYSISYREVRHRLTAILASQPLTVRAALGHFIGCHSGKWLAVIIFFLYTLHFFHDRPNHKLTQRAVAFGNHGVQYCTAQPGGVLGLLVKADLIGMSAWRGLGVLQHLFGNIRCFAVVVLGLIGKWLRDGHANVEGALSSIGALIGWFSGRLGRCRNICRCKIKQHFVMFLGHVSPYTRWCAWTVNTLDVQRCCALQVAVCGAL